MIDFFNTIDEACKNTNEISTNKKWYTLSLGYPGDPFTKYTGRLSTVELAQKYRDWLVQHKHESEWKSACVILIKTDNDNRIITGGNNESKENN